MFLTVLMICSLYSLQFLEPPAVVTKNQSFSNRIFLKSIFQSPQLKFFSLFCLYGDSYGRAAVCRLAPILIIYYFWSNICTEDDCTNIFLSWIWEHLFQNSVCGHFFVFFWIFFFLCTFEKNLFCQTKR